MGNLPAFVVGDLQRDPSGTSRQLMMAKTQHLLFDVAEHFTQGTPESTYSVGKHDSRLDCVFANAAALRAVRRFTAKQMVMVRQVKLEAPDKNKLEKDFGNSWEMKQAALLRKL